MAAFLRKKKIATVLTYLGLTLGLSACGSNPVVGILLPTTGNASSYGESIESGIRVALAEAREVKGLPQGFELVWMDTGSDPAQAVTKLKEMVDKRGVKMVIGGATSDEARTMIPELEKLDVVCLSPSASAPDLAKKSKLFFRIYPSDELEGGRAGRFIFETLKAKTTLLLIGNNDYTRGIEPEFLRKYSEQLGGKVVGRVPVDEEGWETDAVGALKKEQPEAVYLIGYADDIARGIRFLRKRGYDGRIVTTSALYTGKAIQDLGPLAEGVFFPLPPFDRTSQDEDTQRFVKRYMDTYQRAPDIFAAHGYDAMRIVIEVMRIAKPPETPEIEKALHFGISEFKGVTGPILFNDYGEVKHYPKMFIIKDGQVLSYEVYLKQERRRILRQVQELLGMKQKSAGNGT